MTIRPFLFLAALLAAAPTHAQEACPAGHLVTIEPAGTASRGSKDRLREAVRLPQRAGLAWFAQSPAPACEAQPPLKLAMPGGVRQR